jgi:hypothetical protein
VEMTKTALRQQACVTSVRGSVSLLRSTHTDAKAESPAEVAHRQRWHFARTAIR